VRVTVLGAEGMLGHKLVQSLRHSHDVAGTIRASRPDAALERAIGGTKIYPNVDAWQLESVVEAINNWRPSVVINCIGIIKQIEAASDPVESIAINALFPNQLARLTQAQKVKLIHFSTDCVFSGKHGNYTEDDCPDPPDLYGRTKLLGEVSSPDSLTLRTSIIGQELRGHHGLIDWFLGQRGGHAKGFANARFSGLTTLDFAELVGYIIRAQPDLHGLWHVSSDSISKFDLLRIVNRIYGLEIELGRDETLVCDRSLNSARFRKRTGWQPPSWEDMITRMHAEAGIYGYSP
jgi:dTDP-4-dehydrorhamnose reductase